MHNERTFDFQSLPLRSADYAATLGPTVVIAPHPDDESLGCGGLLALLRKAGVPVWCVLVSDGSMSHPNSVKFPAAARQALRATELRLALTELGVDSNELQTLNLTDGAVPTPDTPTGAMAVQHLYNFLQQIGAKTILCPWRRDPHPDHRATSELVRSTIAKLPQPPRLLEYVVWAWERAAPADLPQPGEATGWRLDISAVLPQKQRAIAAHRSQLAPGIIDDDPTGFLLSADMLAHFAQPFEAYLEVD
ncbi:PIG-L family deacetylase [Hymenobacter sp. BT186]|uniref:PIG-L family deacetylase n=1 Tax=Hymenobacter telluris TaxID=2816474 RepID=A0A939JCE7_9BACT|nr:PIG-L deacetylase family protein [Hymenobacter telluris]MBO0357748.1 PIG-L family deacetylase [Hymenobacter telluris]MBW3373775.1 PIG-L family deacetylase [Hymenobacter norwichensis]